MNLDKYLPENIDQDILFLYGKILVCNYKKINQMVLLNFHLNHKIQYYILLKQFYIYSYNNILNKLN